MPIAEITSIAKAFAESGMFPDTRHVAQAIVKIQAGQELGIPPFAAMTGIHIIQGKPTIGSGIIASRIKASGKYNYEVVEMTDEICTLDFYEGEKKKGTVSFTIHDAKKAGTKNLEKFPKNMLFARCVSNGVKWYCPDVFSGPVYTPEEMEVPITEDVPEQKYEVSDTVKTESKPLTRDSSQWGMAVKWLADGGSIEAIELKYKISDEDREQLLSEAASYVEVPNNADRKAALLSALGKCTSIEEVDALGKQNAEEVVALGIRNDFLRKRVSFKTKQSA